MSHTNSRLIDEIARLATDAAAVAQGARREVESVIRAQLEKLLSEANVVSRDDYEATRAMAMRLADEVETVKARLDRLETRAQEVEDRLAELVAEYEAVVAKLGAVPGATTH